MEKTKLDELREQIDEIDAQMAVLFEARMKVVEGIIGYKKEHNMQILQENRELEVIANGIKRIKNEDLKLFYSEYLSNLMKLSREYQAAILAKGE